MFTVSVSCRKLKFVQLDIEIKQNRKPLKLNHPQFELFGFFVCKQHKKRLMNILEIPQTHRLRYLI